MRPSGKQRAIRRVWKSLNIGEGATSRAGHATSTFVDGAPRARPGRRAPPRPSTPRRAQAVRSRSTSEVLAIAGTLATGQRVDEALARRPHVVERDEVAMLRGVVDPRARERLLQRLDRRTLQHPGGSSSSHDASSRNVLSAAASGRCSPACTDSLNSMHGLSSSLSPAVLTYTRRIRNGPFRFFAVDQDAGADDLVPRSASQTAAARAPAGGRTRPATLSTHSAVAKKLA